MNKGENNIKLTIIIASGSESKDAFVILFVVVLLPLQMIV